MPSRTSSTTPGSLACRTRALSMVSTLLLFAVSAGAQQMPAALLSAPQAAAQVPGQANGAVHGAVSDPDDAAIPGATVILTPASGKAITTTSGSDGNYTLRGVPAGNYSVTVTLSGFATFVRQGVRIAAGANLTLNAKLAIQEAETIVNVTAAQNQVSVDPDAGAGQTVLTGKDLDALSDDPDELSSELTALAGPAAGPNGGQIYIDGFTGGQLPPKSSIREIRINQNPFSAQYDRAGFGRIEVFTKPGTDKFHGSAQTNFQDRAFNTGSPFIGNTPQPTYHTIFFIGNLTGPLNKKASFSAGGSYRDIQDNSIVNPPAIFSTSQTSGIACYPLQAGCSYFSTKQGNGFTFAQLVPQTRWDIAPRVDLALGEKNTATIRFQYTHNTRQEQGIGTFNVPSVGTTGNSSEATIQISDTHIFNSKVINEIHFEYQRPVSSTTPYSTSPYVSVQGAFNGGGSAGGSSQDTQNHIEFQNYTSIALAKNFIRFGGRLRTTNETETTSAGSNGIFSYTGICNYTALAQACADSNSTVPANGLPLLTSYTITHYTNPTTSARATDIGLYAETDWKIKPNWTISYGLRYETQNFIHDHADFAPRFSTAHSVGKKTVARLGFGLFYDRFNIGNELNVDRNNGINQQQYTGSAVSPNHPVSTIPASCSPTNVSACLSASSASELTINQISSNLRAPYSIQINAGIDQQLFRNATLAINYQHIRGVHQFNSDVPNFATASATQPLVYQYQSEGEFNQNQLIANVNIRNFHTASISGYYVLNFANADTSGAGGFASTPNHLKADYGRASYDTRQRLFLSGSYTAPHLISFSPLLVATSGSPFNILSGADVYGDNQFNNRAVFVPAGTAATPGNYVKTINGCGTFATPNQPGATGLVPINYCTGPASFTFNLRVVKTIGFGAKTAAQNAREQRQQQGGGRGGPPGGGGPGGGPGGGGRGGGGAGGGGFGGGGASSGRKYNLSFGAQFQNLFNIVDRNVPVGTITSPSFGTSTQLAGNIYTSDSAVRRIYLQAGFTF